MALPWPFTKSAFFLPLFLQNLIEHDPIFLCTGMYLTSRNKLPEIKTPCTSPWQNMTSLAQPSPGTYLGSGGEEGFKHLSVSDICKDPFTQESHTHIFTIILRLTFPMTPYWSKRKVSDLKIRFAPMWTRWMADQKAIISSERSIQGVENFWIWRFSFTL